MAAPPSFASYPYTLADVDVTDVLDTNIQWAVMSADDGTEWLNIKTNLPFNAPADDTALDTPDDIFTIVGDVAHFVNDVGFGDENDAGDTGDLVAEFTDLSAFTLAEANAAATRRYGIRFLFRQVIAPVDVTLTTAPTLRFQLGAAGTPVTIPAVAVSNTTNFNADPGFETPLTGTPFIAALPAKPAAEADTNFELQIFKPVATSGAAVSSFGALAGRYELIAANAIDCKKSRFLAVNNATTATSLVATFYDSSSTVVPLMTETVTATVLYCENGCIKSTEVTGSVQINGNASFSLAAVGDGTHTANDVSVGKITLSGTQCCLDVPYVGAAGPPVSGVLFKRDRVSPWAVVAAIILVVLILFLIWWVVKKYVRQ